jgi:hypothetical protein
MLSMFFVFGGARSLFEDSDSGWHIRNGERIISGRVLPYVDPFSFSMPGQPWMAWEWAPDVLMGAADHLFGFASVALIYGLLIGACVWIWFHLNDVAGGNIVLAGLLFVPMLTTTAIHWVARPHIFSWLFLLGAVWFCERLPDRPHWRHFLLAALAATAWANVHPSFFFFPLIALTYAAGDYLKPHIWRRSLNAFNGVNGRNYVLIAVAASLGTLANPYGWRLHWHVLSYLSDSALLGHIAEFQSFNFYSAGGLQVTFVLAICFMGGFAALAMRNPARFLLAILFTTVALRSQRSLPVAALVLLPLANGSITSVLSDARGLTSGLRSRLDALLAYGVRLHALGRPLRGFALVPVAAILIFMFARTRAAFPTDTFPVGASAIVASLPADARILAPDTFGGFLIYRFNGERKVFFDGRSDFYGQEFVTRYLRLMAAERGWRDEFNRWGFTFALLPPINPLIPALEASGWRELYRDETAVLLTGKSRL